MVSGVSPVNTESDAAVIEVSRREPAAFGTLFDRHATVLFRYLVRRVGPGEADGMLGEVFRIAFERRGDFDVSRSDARPWLYGIASNLLSNHRRHEARRLRATARLLAGQTASEDATEHVAARLDAAASWPGVIAAIDALPDVERSALFLHVWEGLSYEEIATSLDIPVGTVRSRLNRARRRMRVQRSIEACVHE